MTTLFTKIVKGEIPCHKIMEDDEFLAFLDIRPINPGHTLVIPKKEVDYIFDVDNRTLNGLMIFAKKVAKSIQKAVTCKRIGMMVAGLEVPHCHLHLIPINRVLDLNFANSKQVSDQELAAMAERIRLHIH